MKVIDKVDEYFQQACGSNGCADMKSVFKLLWSTLTNAVSAVDLAGVYSISIPANNPIEALSRDLFHDFIKAFARLKYPSGADYLERLLEELRQSRGGLYTGTVPPAPPQKNNNNNPVQVAPPQPSGLAHEGNLVYSIADKTIVRILLKYDLPLRRAFSAFSGQAVRVGGMVSWEEVKTLNLGMELDGLITFAGAYSLLPNHLSSQQLEIIFREISTKYSLLANNNTLHTTILYPQFQLMLILLAVERVEVLIKKNEKVDKIFAKKPVDGRVKLLSDCLIELFKDMGVHRFEDSLSYPLQYRKQHLQKSADPTATGAGDLTTDKSKITSSEAQLDFTLGPDAMDEFNDNNGGEESLISTMMKARSGGIAGGSNNNPDGRGASPAKRLTGHVTLPTQERKEDLYTASGNNTKQVQLLRLDHLFEDIRRKLMNVVSNNVDKGSATNNNNNNNNTTIGPAAAAVTTGSVVTFADTAMTANTATFPETNLSFSGLSKSQKLAAEGKVFTVQDLLAVLSTPSDENIGVDTKSRLPTKPVVICDALPIPSDCPDTVDQLLEAALAHHNLGAFEDSLKFLEAGRIQLHEIIETNKKRMALSTSGTGGGSTTKSFLNLETNFHDIQMYLLVCKGNVYQSCGDDEQSLVNYLDAYQKSQTIPDIDWEIIALNSIGVLAFFNLRYDVALLCFYLVYDFRDRTYGSESPDTATALNNLGCCLYCLNRRGESRLKFERAWNIFSRTIGHRASRTVLVWKNLEKARRSHASIQTKKDFKESIELRADVDKLILGGKFTIQAAVIAEGKKKKKKGGGGKKKKK